MDRPRVITKQVHSEKFRKAGIMVLLLNVTTCVHPCDQLWQTVMKIDQNPCFSCCRKHFRVTVLSQPQLVLF